MKAIDTFYIHIHKDTNEVKIGITSDHKKRLDYHAKSEGNKSEDYKFLYLKFCSNPEKIESKVISLLAKSYGHLKIKHATGKYNERFKYNRSAFRQIIKISEKTFKPL